MENSNGISKGVDKYPFENILEIKDEDIVF
jgi:hypothetical protein